MIKKQEKYFGLALLTLMALFSLLRIYRIVTTTLSPIGATDFHSYWYSGNFVIQGIDPFEAYLNNRSLTFPIKYLDGQIIDSLPATQQQLERVPANTALMVLLLTPFSFFSWQTAKISWMVINLFILFLVPTLVIKLYPNSSTLPKKSKAMVCLALWGLLATSNAIGNGQTTYLVFALSLTSILTGKRHWFIAGTALGLALSKYSLSLPFFVFILLFQKNYRAVIVAIVFQFLGFLSLSVISETPLISLLAEYWKIAVMHLREDGINITSILSPHNFLAYLLIFILAILALWACFYMFNRSDFSNSSFENPLTTIYHIHALNLFNLWILLSLYHREYDAITYILFVSLIIFGLSNNYWNLPKIVRDALIISIIIVTLALSRPGDSIVRYVPTALAPIGKLLSADWMTSLALLIAFIINIWLSFKIGDSRDLIQSGT